MDELQEKVFRQLCIDHLRMKAGKSDDDLAVTSTYDLFIAVYQSLEPLIEEKRAAREADCLPRFCKADEELWGNGFAVMMFALAEKVGWLKDMKPVPLEQVQ
ncbi:hypothetical protein [Paenibacillus taichungensis]